MGVTSAKKTVNRKGRRDYNEFSHRDILAAWQATAPELPFLTEKEISGDVDNRRWSLEDYLIRRSGSRSLRGGNLVFFAHFAVRSSSTVCATQITALKPDE